jgi:hypothetical protein
MGYNLCRNYLSPYQIAYIHYRYSTNIEIYKTLKNSLYNPKINLISAPTIWHKNVLSEGTIIIKKNQSLTIKKELIMANDGLIVLEKNSTLIVDSGKIYSPNDEWKGIIVKNNSCSKIFSRKKLGKIVIINGGTIVY